MSRRNQIIYVVALAGVIGAVVAIGGQPFVPNVLLPTLIGIWVIQLAPLIAAFVRDLATTSEEAEANRERSPRRRWRIRSAQFAASGGARETRILLAATACLLATGVVMVNTASSTRLGLIPSQTLAVRHLATFAAFGVVGLVLMFVLASGGLTVLLRHSTWLVSLSLVLLLAVHIPFIGSTEDGARRWIGSGALRIEPAELAKLALIVYAAALLARRPLQDRDLSSLWTPLLQIVGAACLFAVSEPNVGAAAVIAFAIAAVLSASGIPLRQLALLAGSVIGLILFYVLLRPYTRARLTSFLDPWAHASTSGYQAVHAQLAIGSGGFLGVGPGHSAQKLFFLPEASTTFILAVIGEELGVLGVVALLSLYAAIAYAGLRIAAAARSLRDALIAVGMTTLIVSQAVLSAFAVLGLAPLIGVPLPFISYNPTDLVAMLATVGILINLSRRNQSPADSTPGTVPVWIGRLPEVTRLRIGASFGVFVILILLAVNRTLYLGIIHHEASAAFPSETVDAMRGPILDRNGVVLAESKPAADVSATPYLLTNKQRAAERLAPLLSESRAEVLRRLDSASGFTYLARAAPLSEAHAILSLNLPGLHTTPAVRRVYPYGALASQVLGFVGTERTGLTGLEYSQNGVLQGRDGRARSINGVLGEAIPVQTLTPVVPGHGVQLTIDARLQGGVESILANACREAGCSGATAIVVAPNTGEILALANRPPFDASRSQSLTITGFNDAVRNRVTELSYEPGPPIEIAIASGVLEEGLTSAFHLGTGTRGEPKPNASDVVADATQLGAKRFGEWIRQFGFGRPTGVDMPGEKSGRLPPTSEHLNPTIARLAIGQGISATPIQLVSAYGAVADGGVLRTPHVIKRLANKAQTYPAGARIMTEGTAAAMRREFGVTGGVGSEATLAASQSGGQAPSAVVDSFVGLSVSGPVNLVALVLIERPERSSGQAGVASQAFDEVIRFSTLALGSSSE